MKLCSRTARRHRGVGHCLGHRSAVKTVGNGEIRIDRPAIEQAARTDGKWVIETNDDTLTAEDAAYAYEKLERH